MVALRKNQDLDSNRGPADVEIDWSRYTDGGAGVLQDGFWHQRKQPSISLDDKGNEVLRLLSTLGAKTSLLANQFDMMDIADRVIKEWLRLRPDQAELVWGSFLTLAPVIDIGYLPLYEQHARELMQTIADGGNWKLPTNAELLIYVMRTSLATPFNEFGRRIVGRLAKPAFPEIWRVFPKSVGTWSEYDDGVEIDQLRQKILQSGNFPARVAPNPRLPHPDVIDEMFERERRQTVLSADFEQMLTRSAQRRELPYMAMNGDVLYLVYRRTPERGTVWGIEMNTQKPCETLERMLTPTDAQPTPDMLRLIPTAEPVQDLRPAVRGRREEVRARPFYHDTESRSPRVLLAGVGMTQQQAARIRERAASVAVERIDIVNGEVLIVEHRYDGTRTLLEINLTGNAKAVQMLPPTQVAGTYRHPRSIAVVPRQPRSVVPAAPAMTRRESTFKGQIAVPAEGPTAIYPLPPVGAQVRTTSGVEFIIHEYQGDPDALRFVWRGATTSNYIPVDRIAGVVQTPEDTVELPTDTYALIRWTSPDGRVFVMRDTYIVEHADGHVHLRSSSSSGYRVSLSDVIALVEKPLTRGPLRLIEVGHVIKVLHPRQPSSVVKQQIVTAVVTKRDAGSLTWDYLSHVDVVGDEDKQGLPPHRCDMLLPEDSAQILRVLPGQQVFVPLPDGAHVLAKAHPQMKPENCLPIVGSYAANNTEPVGAFWARGQVVSQSLAGVTLKNDERRWRVSWDDVYAVIDAEPPTEMPPQGSVVILWEGGALWWLRIERRDAHAADVVVVQRVLFSQLDKGNRITNIQALHFDHRYSRMTTPLYADNSSMRDLSDVLAVLREPPAWMLSDLTQQTFAWSNASPVVPAPNGEPTLDDAAECKLLGEQQPRQTSFFDML